MTPKFRFTIYNDTVAPSGQQVKEPRGWKEIELVLERHDKFYSLIEYLQGDLIWYGDARELLIEIEETDGPEAIATLVVEVAFNRNQWEEVFTCIFDFTLLEEMYKADTPYLLKVPLIRNDFWQKFLNRLNTPVDLMAATDLDGGARVAPTKQRITLSGQTLQGVITAYESEGVQVYRSNIDIGEFENGDINFDYGERVQLAFSRVVSEGMKQFYSLTSAVIPAAFGIPAWQFEPEQSGYYTFDIKLPIIIEGIVGGVLEYFDSELDGALITVAPIVKPYLYVYDVNVPPDDDDYSTRYDFEGHYLETIPTTTNPDVLYDYEQPINLKINRYSFEQTIYLKKNQHVALGFRITTAGNIPYGAADFFRVLVYGDTAFTTSFVNYALTGVNGCKFSVQAATVYEDTEADTLLIKDAAEAIVSKLVGADEVILSDYFEACARNYVLAKGLHIKGWSFDEKKFFMSFQEWWDGANPILNLGLSYETVGGVDKLRIEHKEYFFNKGKSVNLNYVADRQRTYQNKGFTKLIRIGYDEWEAESSAGIDDPQTKRFYSTKFKTIGEEIELYSKFVAAGLAIEQTRRKFPEKEADWRMDESVMIIAVQNDGYGGFTPEFDSEFIYVENLYNSDKRYNLRITPSRNFERWKSFFNGCLINSLPTYFKFAGGEGNYTMASSLLADDCDAGDNPELAENQDIAATSGFLFTPKYYNFVHPMTWEIYKTIRDNRHYAIGISTGNTDHETCFIDRLTYKLIRGEARIKVNFGGEESVDTRIFDDTFDEMFE